MTNKKWSDEVVAQVADIAGDTTEVSAATVTKIVSQLGEDYTARSVASKLRRMGYNVESMATPRTPAFSDSETAALVEFVNQHAGAYTYKEIAANFAGGTFDAKRIQGKLLALELTSKVKPAEKVEAAKAYNPDQEATFIKMALNGAFIEDIAAALGKEINSVRGKALSLTRTGQISKIPTQREEHAKKATVDPVEALGDRIHSMTVAEIAAAVDKTERGMKTLLTRRGIKAADYDGAAKKQKADAKSAAA